MGGDYEQYRDPPQSVERQDVPPLERSVNLAGGAIHCHRDRGSSHGETLVTERD
jgi:hypothetical protein